jgi:protease-4
MRDFYTGFLDKTAASRHKTRDEVHALAQGRVWTGAQAKENGLVDRLAGSTWRSPPSRNGPPSTPTPPWRPVYPRRRTLYEALDFGSATAAVLSLVRR